MDIVPPARRSAMMSRIRGRDTRPELLGGRQAHRLGFRFRLHRQDLPGTPDLVFPGRRKVIFVHGCFWHQHPHCRKASIPKTRTRFWEGKLDAIVERDRRSLLALQAAGWDVMTVWECELRDRDCLR